MRITNSMQVSNMLRSLQGSSGRADKLQEQLSSGRRINRPSDDPVGVSRSLKFNRDLAENDQYTRNVKDAMSFLDATDTAVGGVGDILHRLQEIAVNGSNDSLPTASKNALADEVDQLLGQLVQVGNTTHGGVYIFSGERVIANAYTTTGTPITNVNFVGDNGKLKYEIAPGIVDNVNYSGNEVFARAEPATANVGASNSIFERAIQLRDELRSPMGTVAALQDIEGGLAKDLDQILSIRSTVGAKYNKMELSLNRLGTASVNITGQIAANDDTDIAKATMQLKLEENVYNAALAVGAKIIPPSLVDFLR